MTRNIFSKKTKNVIVSPPRINFNTIQHTPNKYCDGIDIDTSYFKISKDAQFIYERTPPEIESLKRQITQNATTTSTPSHQINSTESTSYVIDEERVAANYMCSSTIARYDHDGKVIDFKLKPFPLVDLANIIPNACTLPWKFPAVVLFNDNFESTTLLFSSGVLITTGGSDIEQVFHAIIHSANIVAKYLNKLRIRDDDEYKDLNNKIVLYQNHIGNIVLPLTLGQYKINLLSIVPYAKANRWRFKFNKDGISILYIYPYPELFPGMLIKLTASGGCSFVGLKYLSDVQFCDEFLKSWFTRFLVEIEDFNPEEYKAQRIEKADRNAQIKKRKKETKRLAWDNDIKDANDNLLYIAWKSANSHKLTQKEFDIYNEKKDSDIFIRAQNRVETEQQKKNRLKEHINTKKREKKRYTVKYPTRTAVRAFKKKIKRINKTPRIIMIPTSFLPSPQI